MRDFTSTSPRRYAARRARFSLALSIVPSPLGGWSPGWAPLRDRARERVRAGALAAYRGLAAYDLGGGELRYHLNGGPASAKYRVYHRLLLGQLARIPYLPARWRVRVAS